MSVPSRRREATLVPLVRLALAVLLALAALATLAVALAAGHWLAVVGGGSGTGGLLFYVDRQLDKLEGRR